MSSENSQVFSTEDFVRRMLIITVGSSATIHLLGSVAERYPEILFMNKIMIVETSKKVFDDAIAYLSEIYHNNYAKLRGKGPEEQRRGFPTSKFTHELKNNSVLLGTKGGGSTPDRGLDMYENKSTDVINKIVDIVMGVEQERELSGIIVLGAAGKGTGTSVTPALTKDIMSNSHLPTPLGILTIPFRFEEEHIRNAEVVKEWLKKVPLTLIDYERAVGNYVYLRGTTEKEVSTIELYKMVVEALSEMLKNLIEALNFSTKCNPPLDWSDLASILSPGYIGTITYSVRSTRDEFIKNWKDDLATLLLLRTKTKPRRTRAKVIIKGTNVPLVVDREILKFHRKYLNAIAGRHLLNIGDGFSITSIIHGFNPEEIVPPIKLGESIVERLFGF